MSPAAQERNYIIALLAVSSAMLAIPIYREYHLPIWYDECDWKELPRGGGEGHNLKNTQVSKLQRILPL